MDINDLIIQETIMTSVAPDNNNNEKKKVKDVIAVTKRQSGTSKIPMINQLYKWKKPEVCNEETVFSKIYKKCLLEFERLKQPK